MPRKSKSTLIEAPAVLSDPVVSHPPTFSSPVLPSANNEPIVETKKPAAKRTKKVSTEETVVVNPPVVTQSQAQLAPLRSENVEPVKKGRAKKKTVEVEVVEEHPIEQLCPIVCTPCSKDVPSADIPLIVDNTTGNIGLEEEEEEAQTEKQPAKKRGRKPKGGKIVQQLGDYNAPVPPKPNIILHLKCYMKDLEEVNVLGDVNVSSYQFSSNKQDLGFDVLPSTSEMGLNEYVAPEGLTTQIIEDSREEEREEMPIVLPHNELQTEVGGATITAKKVEQKELWKKLKILSHSLHMNNNTDKKSCCFWDTVEFDNPPVHIPKFCIKDTYHVYGVFCSPECAVAHLMQENVDISVKFERYHLLNFLYGKIYNYDRNVKPAPDPHYLLSKYCGNLTIQEYRSLLRKERLYLVVDKPITRIMPELHEDNDEFILNNKIIQSNNIQSNKKSHKSSTKNVFPEHFGFS
jgi:hypothetical protein